jgi:chromosomal replication initiator protein
VLAGRGAGADGPAPSARREAARPGPARELTQPEDPLDRVKRRLVAEVGDERFCRHFSAPVRLAVVDGCKLRVTVPNKAQALLVERRFGAVLRQVVRLEGMACEDHSAAVDIVIDAASSMPLGLPTTESAPRVGNDSSSATTGTPGLAEHPPRRPSAARAATSDRYRLESFVVGASNRLAYNAAVQMSEGGLHSEHSTMDRLAGDGLLGHSGGVGTGSPNISSPNHSPSNVGLHRLFMHGPCGVGKTHLLQGVALRFKERFPGAIVRVTSGEQFMNEFVAAVRAGGMPSASSNGPGPTASGSGSGIERFRRSFRKVDLLCIDDVHFLANKQSTQVELLNTFDEIERGGSRIVLASDEHPRMLAKFSPALVSRFMAGMVAGLSAPDFETRERLVRILSSNRRTPMDEQAIALLVERSGPMPGQAAATVRDLEGLLTKIEAIHRLLPEYRTPDGRIGPLAVERALAVGESGATPAEHAAIRSAAAPSRPVPLALIKLHVCTALAVDPIDLAGKTRHRRVVLSRALITHLARQLTTLSYPEIARGIGRPNHSTVITAHQRLAKQLEADEPVEAPNAPEARTLTVLTRQLGQAIKLAASRA